MESSKVIWGNILSQKVDVIIDEFNAIGDQEKSYILDHLYRMTSENGWHPGQITSAQFALQVLGKDKK